MADQSLLTEEYLHRITGRLNALDTVVVWILGELSMKSADPEQYAAGVIDLLRKKMPEGHPVMNASGDTQRLAIEHFNRALSELINDFARWKQIVIDEPKANGKKPGDYS